LLSVKNTFIKQTKFLVMKKTTFRAICLTAFTVALGINKSAAQTYNWTGSSSNDFYSTANWTSTQGAVAFDDTSFKTVRTNATGQSPVINQFVAWQPGIFDATGGNLTVNADFNCFFNDFLNGTVTVNTGAIFTCRNIIRVGNGAAGTVNVNGTLRANNVDTWQGIFIGVLANGNGTVNVNSGGVLNGGYQVEVGTRDFYPTGVLNINEGGLSEAYWETWIGPNGTINVNGGTINTGQVFNVGNLTLDNATNAGTVGAVVGRLNINSGTVTVNHNDLAAPSLVLNNAAKITIDNGTLRIMRTGTDFTSQINDHKAAGRIVAVAGKEIVVSFDGVYTNVTAQTVSGLADVTKNAFTVYPNPATDFISIQSQDGLSDTVTVSIINLLGEVVAKHSVNAATENNINISALSAGMYMVKAESATATSVTKIIKK